MTTSHDTERTSGPDPRSRPSPVVRGLAPALGLLLVATLSGVLIGAVGSPAQGVDAGRISFHGTAEGPAATCGAARLRYDYAVTGGDNDGAFSDHYVVLTVDGAGVPQDVDYGSTPTGTSRNEDDATDLGAVHPLTARPISLLLYDVTGDPRIEVPVEDSQKAYDWTRRNGNLVSVDTIDPAGVPGAGACASLPLHRAAPALSARRQWVRTPSGKKRLLLRVHVTAPDRAAPSGKVRVRLRHRAVSATLSQGTATLRLPRRIRRAPKRVMVRYSGDAWTAPSHRRVRIRPRR